MRARILVTSYQIMAYHSEHGEAVEMDRNGDSSDNLDDENQCSEYLSLKSGKAKLFCEH